MRDSNDTHSPDTAHTLDPAAAADHFRVRPRTIQIWIRDGKLQSYRIGRAHRMTWAEIWACEDGPKPTRKTEARYRLPLMTRAELASRLAISDRTVDRWIADGLPARNVFGLTRFNPVDAEEWLRRRHDPTLPYGFVSEGLA
ncbi:helix-turn-helix domain-containing protein [Yangia mangrovi]|uniref:DNA-binding protein n=1 Tax=Alloyangia mangrovi TaxID=1779329 RepID=A0A2A3K0H3_9RHOB|nr:helix-turn-helix domain-containing protein [Alloyangia mangrovi]MCT4373434.1 helix-turn-helix domain-containing protein [Alloyangia mangrovi]